jgi:hypothetical protein
MPKGYITCPVCRGAGKVTENSRKYDFVTRDPKTSGCLICAGTGHVPTRHLLPDGTRARDLPLKLAKVTDTKRRAIPELPLQSPPPVAQHSNAASDPASPAEPLDLALSRRGIDPDPVAQHSNAADPEPPVAQHSNAASLGWPTADVQDLLTLAQDALIIESTHPAYPKLYATLRAFEINRGKWDHMDEDAYIAGLHAHITHLQDQMEAHHG